MERAIAGFLEGLKLEAGGFPGEELTKTPARVARAWADDLLSGYAQDPAALMTTSPTPAGSGPVVVRELSFQSVCVHHLLPFFGVAHVAYLPGERIAGLSKLARVVDAHARRLQTQEHLTASIVATLDEVLSPRGVLAVLTAEHTCMSLRGVRKEQGMMTTLAASGIYDEPEARREMLAVLAPAGRFPGAR